MLGCTLKGNQLRHCAAKPIIQLAIITNTSGFYARRASIQGPTDYESDALPTEPLGLLNKSMPYIRKTRQIDYLQGMLEIKTKFLYFLQRKTTHYSIFSSMQLCHQNVCTSKIDQNLSRDIVFPNIVPKSTVDDHKLPSPGYVAVPSWWASE